MHFEVRMSVAATRLPPKALRRKPDARRRPSDRTSLLLTNGLLPRVAAPNGERLATLVCFHVAEGKAKIREAAFFGWCAANARQRCPIGSELPLGPPHPAGNGDYQSGRSGEKQGEEGLDSRRESSLSARRWSHRSSVCNSRRIFSSRSVWGSSGVAMK